MTMAIICDGTKNRETGNCDEAARWLLRRAGEGGAFHAACDRHMAQVGRYLLGGERGALDVQSIHTDES
jgi:hypothetical protein